MVQVQILPVPNLLHAPHVQSSSAPKRILRQKLVNIKQDILQGRLRG